ncbi:MAG TPA: hypothetical protein VGX92_02635 [Pyrinomonadaceae bacterium]|jgi:hypothetical protein|nr:hypothetical protein [Pyrinomonadaceae bacterium]
MTKMNIIYSGFYDAPLAFVVNHEDTQYLFWRGFFDEVLDDYPHEYEVFVLPNLPENEIKESWSCLPDKAVAHVGKIHMNQVGFDPTKRQSITTDVFEKVLK